MQFTSGGILARVCSLCLEKGKEAEAPAESLAEEPSSGSKVQSPGNLKTATAPFWQQPQATGPTQRSSEVIDTKKLRPEMALSQADFPEAPTSGVGVEGKPLIPSSLTGAAAIEPVPTVATGNEGRRESGFGERNVSTAGAVSLEGFSFKDGLSQDRPESRRPSVAAEPSRRSIPQHQGPGDNAALPPFPETATETFVLEGSSALGAVNSSRAAALDRAASKQGKKGKTRVVDLYDELLVGETGAQAGRVSESGESASKSGDVAQSTPGSETRAALPPTRASSLR